MKPDAEPANWICECGAKVTPYCRWNGSAWEHHHGYPIGHVTMDWIPALIEKQLDELRAENTRLRAALASSENPCAK